MGGTNRQTLDIGALKATGGKGLQPAMDHILANQDKPVPDATSVSTSTPLAGDTGGGDGVDEDEDMKAAIALSQEGVEAKVRGKGKVHQLTWASVLIDWWGRAVD